MVFDPPVNMLNMSSGLASDSGTLTFSSGRSISSAISMPIAVVMPWPTSARGSW
jgi:hypothetical protein